MTVLAGNGQCPYSCQPLPKIEPIRPAARREPFGDPGWLFEVKCDGFRGLACIGDGGCRLEHSVNNGNGKSRPWRHALRDESPPGAASDRIRADDDDRPSDHYDTGGVYVVDEREVDAVTRFRGPSLTIACERRRLSDSQAAVTSALLAAF